MTSGTKSMKRQTQNEFENFDLQQCCLFVSFENFKHFYRVVNRIAQTRPEFRTTDDFMLSPGKSSVNWTDC